MNKWFCCTLAIGLVLSPFAFSETLKINNLTVEVVEGSITLQQADAIILPFFHDMILRNGEIINTVTIGAEPIKEATVLEIAIANALAIAGGAGLKSVAILGAENASTLFARESAHTILTAIRAYAKRGGHVEHVRILIENPEAYQTFVKVLNQLNAVVGFCDVDLNIEDKVSRR